MNVILKVSMANYDKWKEAFDNHTERATVCDESKTTVGKVDDTNCITISCGFFLFKWQHIGNKSYVFCLNN